MNWKRIALPVALLASHLAAQPQLPPIREFVHRVYFDTTPYEQAIRYDASVTPTLLQMLEDPKEEPYWGTIVLTAGMIGDPSASEPLIRFLMRGEGKLSAPAYVAKSNVLFALGYIVNRSREKSALAFLKQGVNPATWDQIRWSSPFFESSRDRNEQLAIMSILGLALTGHPSARETLLEVQKRTASEPAAFRANAADAVKTALHDFDIIASSGLVNYYRQGLPKGEYAPVPEAKPNLQAPPGTIVGAEKPAPIVTEYAAAPAIPPPAMKRPKLPPKPAKAKPAIPAPAYKTPPPIKGAPPATGTHGM